MQEVIETLSAAKAPKKDGKGDRYGKTGSLPLLGAARTGSVEALLKAVLEGGVRV